MGEKERKSKNNKNKEKHTHEIHRIIQNWKENIMSSIFLAMQKKTIELTSHGNGEFQIECEWFVLLH